MRSQKEFEAAEIMAALDAKYTKEQLCELFLGRQHDTLFEHLGRLVSDRMIFEPHIYVWFGYEAATRSKWCGAFFAG